MSKKRAIPLLDMVQFVAALLIVLVHCGRLAENEAVHFFLKSILCRLAVPIFFISSGYFYRLKQRKEKQYFKTYFRKHISVYLLWSLLYLPLGLRHLLTLDVSFKLLPAALALSLSYWGVWYHLWYYPALFVGVFLAMQFQKRLGYISSFIIAFSAYTIGSVETYSSYLKGSVVAEVYYVFKNLFFTTKNGVTYALIFILLGFVVADLQQKKSFSLSVGKKLLVSLSLLLAEGLLIYFNQGDDKNFIFSLIPVTFFLFIMIIQNDHKKEVQVSYLKPLTKYIFLIHPFIIEVVHIFREWLGQGELQGFTLFTISAVLTLLLAIVVIEGKKKVRVIV